MRVLIISGLILVSFAVFGQSPNAGILTIDKNSHDFGRITAEAGKVMHRFSFSNSGSVPLVITRVRTTCDCTSPSWSKGPVKPQAEGYVDIEFDPSDRKGEFHKTIQIQSTAQNSNMFLTISGSIVPPIRKEELHYALGELKVKKTQVNLGYLYKGDTGKDNLTVSNSSSEPMRIDFGNVPDYIKISSMPETLEAGEYGQFEVEFCSKKSDEWDVLIDQVSVIINGEELKENKLTIAANIREDFSKYTTEQLGQAPVAVFDKDIIKLGVIDKSEPIECKFKIANEGTSELVIRSIKPSCGCTVAKPEKTILAAGEFTFLYAVFDPAGRSGAFKNGITVVTNDPAHYKKYLFLEGSISTTNR